VNRPPVGISGLRRTALKSADLGSRHEAGHNRFMVRFGA
jgi:hypothetical protein